MNIVCNICGSKKFNEFGIQPRINAQCSKCKSLERHRAVVYIIDKLNMIDKNTKCLHLAPEKSIYNYLKKIIYEPNYITADAKPNRYNFTTCIAATLPRDFNKFQNNFFDLLLHNHVLEHLPGCYRDHINEFYRILKKDGIMIFTIPDLDIIDEVKITKEGGEFLTEEERFIKYDQKDHFKRFGTDLIEFIRSKFKEIDLLLNPKDESSSKLIKKNNAKGIVFVCKK